MKKMRSLMAMMLLVGVMSVLGVNQAFGAPIIPPFKPMSSGHSVSSLFGDVYDYFTNLLSADGAEQTNDVGVIVPNYTPQKPKPQGNIPPSATNDAGIIHSRP